MGWYGTHRDYDRNNRIGFRRHRDGKHAGRPFRHTRVRGAHGFEGRVGHESATKRHTQGPVEEPFRDGRRGRRCGRPRISATVDVGQGGTHVCANGVGFSYTACQTLWQALNANWRDMRGEFALAGVDWRSWSAADRVSATYVLLKRNLRGDTDALRNLYTLTGDKNALAVLDREIMGQTPQITTSR